MRMVLVQDAVHNSQMRKGWLTLKSPCYLSGVCRLNV